MVGPTPDAAGTGPGTTGSDELVFHADTRQRSTWTSDLSVAEAAAVRRVGLVPAGFVMGTAVMQLAAAGSQLYGQWGVMGGQSIGRGRGYSESFPCAHTYGFSSGVGLGGASQEHFGFSVEDDVLAASLTSGYQLAIDRLHDEASQLGAHGVVGVDLFFENLVGAQGTATFFARGTAVTHPGGEAVPVPFTTNASGQHFERLVGLGYVPTGLAVGVGAVYVQPNCQARGDFTVGGAIRQIPSAIAVARSRARTALAATAHAVGDGVVHTEWTDRRANRYGESWDQLAIAVGTSVRRYSTEVEPTSPRPVVPLRP